MLRQLSSHLLFFFLREKIFRIFISQVFFLSSQVVGNKTAPLKRMVKESTEWAKLESACSMKICDFIDSLQSLQEPLYLFDWSIPTHAPDLAKELVIPKYFAGDFLQRTFPGSLYQDSWPSLFIAPSGLHSDLHVDAFGSNFWMALFQGRKRSVMHGIYIYHQV